MTRSCTLALDTGGIAAVIGSDVLLTIAEFSLALAGFSAVVLVLARRGGEIDEAAAYIVRFMILNAVGAGFLALLPSLVVALGASEPLVWRLSSAVYVVSVVLLTLPLAISQAIEVRGLLARGLSSAFWTLSAAAHLVQLSNAVGFPFAPSFGGFLLGLMLLLGLAGIQFVVVVFRLLR